MWTKTVLLCAIVTAVSGTKKTMILQQIPISDSCKLNSERVFGDFDLSEVPEFGVQCSRHIPPANHKALNFMLDNDVIPILCMGLYDSFQRMCKSEDLVPVPLNYKKVRHIFNELENPTSSFYRLSEFCKITAKGNIIETPASNTSAFWWNELNSQFANEEKCTRLCRTNEDDKVQPLCSFIIWSNQVILNGGKDIENPNNEVGSKEITDGNSRSLGIENKPVPSNTIVQLTNKILTSTVEPTILGGLKSSSAANSSSVDHSVMEISHDEMNLPVNKDTDSNLKIMNPSISQQAEPAIENKIESAVSEKIVKNQKTNQNFTSVQTGINSGNKTNTVSKISPESKDGKQDPSNVLHMLSSPSKKSNSNDSTKVDSETSVLKPETALEPSNAEKTGDGILDAGYSPDVTPEVGDLPLPVGAEKEPSNSAYSEDPEDADGDDIDIDENESPVKTALNGTGLSKDKSTFSAPDQGPSDPDKSYGGESIVLEDPFIETEDSHFFTYFLCMTVITIMAYLAFHNKKKLLALALEGRRSRSSRRRPNSSNYSKLDCSLEEAMSSKTTASVTHVLY